MEVIKVDEKTLDEYVLSSKKPHFMQSSAWGEVNEERGANIHRLLVKDDDRTIGSALLIEKKILKYSTFYCPRGFITDFDNKEDVKKVTEALKEYAYKNGGIYLKIDPDIIIRKLDKDTNVIYEDENHLKLIDLLTELGGKHRGFTTKFTESSTPRFTFRVDVTKDNLLDSFHQTTRNILRRNNPYNLKVYIGDENDIDKFYVPMKETAIRKHMYLEDEKFFRDFYTILHSHGMSDLYIVTANLEEVKDKYRHLIIEASEELSAIKDTNKKGRINDLHDQLAKYQKELKLIEESELDEIVLSSMITVKYGDMIWTLHGANSSSFPFLNANYEMYYQIIKDAKDNGYKWVDFYGTEGKIDKKSEAFGIYQFKVRFGGDFDEFIGEFDFIVRPNTYNVVMSLLKARRKIKYKLQQKRISKKPN